MFETCFYCGQEMWSKKLCTKHQARKRFGIMKGARFARRLLYWRLASDEHLIRRVDGGTRRDNIVRACHYCNSSRGEATPEDHKVAMMALIEASEHPCQTELPQSTKGETN